MRIPHRRLGHLRAPHRRAALAGAAALTVLGTAGAVTATVASAGHPAPAPAGSSSVATVPLAAPSAPTTPARTNPAPDRRPNIVFVLTDDLSYDLVQYMPHVVGLQKAGTTFDNYTVTDSLCCPSRASILSGRYPHNTGVYTNIAPDGGFQAFHKRGGERSTIGTDLQSAGYRTAMMGKYLNLYRPDITVDGEKNYVPPGWDEWAVTGQGYDQYDYTLNHNGRLERHGSKPSDYLNTVLSDKADAFVRTSARSDKPFAIEVASFSPHSPYTPAPQDVGKFAGLRAPRGAAYDRLPTNAPSWLQVRGPLTPQQQARIDDAYRKRVQAVQSVDRLIGGLQRTLRDTGEADNTVVVFSSDNGYHLGQYRLMPGKQTAYDTDVHVPLIAAGPGVARGHRATQPAENIDLRPTFAGLAETSVPRNVDGRDLGPLLAGERPRDWRTTALIEHHGPDFMPNDPDRQRTLQGKPTTYTAIRTTRWTYVQYANGEREYYDRTRDPRMLHNVIGRVSATRLVTLRTTVRGLRACDGRVCHRADRH